MGRRGGRGQTRGGGGSAGMFARRPAPAPAKKAAPPPPAARAPPPAAPPAPVASAPAAVAAPQQRSGGMMSGLMGTMAQGLAFGTGSAVAHQAVGAAARSLTSGSDAQQQPAEQQYQSAAPAASPAAEGGVCAANKKDLMQCLNDNNGDANSCQYFFDALKSCQENAQFA